MAKVTSKLQVTVPKALADRFGITPGDDIEWEAAGDAIRVVPARRVPRNLIAARLARFDQATERQRQREKDSPRPQASERGWTREDLYDRSRAR